MKAPSFTREELMRSLPGESQELVESIAQSAQAVGARVLIVGGPVRDLLLGRPIRDVDLLVGSSADIVEQIARSAVPDDARVVAYGRFGTLRVEVGEARIDLAAMRSETYSRPGALPTVSAGTLEEDLRRRDFSINALAMDLSLDRDEKRIAVIDQVGGLEDLAAQRLRILHPQSFHDDPTRVLRAARLGARLGFSLARPTRAALRNALRDGVFGSVSGDRLRREIEKCFTDATLGLDPPSALRRLAEWHVLTALEPGLELPRTCVTALRRLGRSAANPVWRAPRHRSWIAGLSIWLAPIPPALRRRTLVRFNVRGEAAKRILGFPRVRDGILRQLGRARGRGGVDAALFGIAEEELLALHAVAEPAVRRRIERWAAEDRLRRVPLSGNDLTAKGLEGPAVGRILLRVRAAFLDGEVANREEATALAEELMRRSARRPGSGRSKKKRAGGQKAREPRG